ncbi:MAG TPA: acetylornithine/succinylornithine family transaminase [Candidatus Gemmiger avistercoris]|uniref:Acetylornithine aminotransferase n=1 Tax=Candidatus Gemmiger avistercoris TaxID=2838606 RepID=A0A9D2FIF5_9FIRM|nr:acetylornithine/succinylornithine family transaminase [uncultured Subdoligranulum sp.]HIZ61834.1 acetylornithine/succinylornithine family transaminase [Candidatus Gemmiger avistercoris]
MNTQAIIARDDANVLHTYGRSPIALVEGRGMYARDAEGREYLDFTSGIGVNALGFCHPAWVAAVSAQAGRLQHTSNLYYTEPCGALAEELCRRTGLDAVFFGNSGAEANEGAIKAARKYSVDTYGPGRSKVLTLVNSFHGRTLATLTATGQEVFHRDFGPFPEQFAYVPAGDLAALREAAGGPDTCALLLELVQGEGGVVALEKAYVEQVAAFCRQRDILLLVDEVQTGVGRTGTFLACEQYGLQPDIVTLAKGLGGGLPIGAVLMTRKVAQHMGPGSHGSTFGGNPVACAGALAVLGELTDDRLAKDNALAAALRAGLQTLPHVQAVTGLGLMVGVAFADGVSAAAVRTACERQGLLVLTAKTRLRLLPPLILTQEDVDKALAILRSVLESL